MPDFRNTFKPKNLHRVVGNKIHREELKLGDSTGRKTGGPGASPGKIFQDHALQIVGKRPIFGEFAMKEAKDHDWWCPFPQKFKKGTLM